MTKPLPGGEEVEVRPSGPKQRNRTSRRYVLGDLLQGIGLCNCGSWWGKSEILGQASERAGGGSLLSTGSPGRILSPPAKPQLCS